MRGWPLSAEGCNFTRYNDAEVSKFALAVRYV